MLENSSEELKTLVLLEFTEKLIIHSSPTVFLEKIEKKEAEILEKTRKDLKGLEQKKKEFESAKTERRIIPVIKEQKTEIRKGIIESRVAELKENFKPESNTPISQEIFTKQIPTTPTLPKKPNPVLRVPETRLPPQFAYLKPTYAQEIQLDLGKLNPLINDPAVKIIESNGPEQQVIVKGRMGTKPTSIILTREEINNIINIFSGRAKIPVGRGATEIALGRFIMSALVSDEGSGFVIKKIPKLVLPRPNF